MNHLAQDALNRMARAERRGTGCHLTAEMIEALNVTFLAEIWSDADPRTGKFHGRKLKDPRP